MGILALYIKLLNIAFFYFILHMQSLYGESQSVMKRCQNLEASEAIVFIKKEYIPKKDYKKASDCLEIQFDKNKKDLNIRLFLARLWGWMHEFKKAHQLLESTNHKDQEVIFIKSDLYWYEGKCEKVLDIFKKQPQLREQIPSHIQNYLNICESEIDLQNKISDSFNENELVSVAKNLIQSQDSRAQIMETELTHHFNLKSSISLLYEYQKRIYDIEFMQENIFGFKGSYSFHQLVFSLSFKKTVVQKFSYQSASNLFLTYYQDDYYWGLDIQSKQYIDVKTFGISPYFAKKFSSYEVYYKFFNNYKNQSVAISNHLRVKKVISEFSIYLWGSYGNKESERPYLVSSTSVHGSSYGIGMNLNFSDHLNIFSEFEYSTEPNYWQRSYSLGGKWSF